MADDGELETYSFRAKEDRVQLLDHLIDRKNAALPPGSDERVNRSDLLRECVEDLIDELESELDSGNPRARAAPMAD